MEVAQLFILDQHVVVKWNDLVQGERYKLFINIFIYNWINILGYV